MSAAQPQSLRLLRLEHAVARVLTDVNRGREAFEDLMPICGGLLGWAVGVFWVPTRSGRLWPGLVWQGESGHRESFAEAMRPMRLRPGEGLAGRAFTDERADSVADIAAGSSERAQMAVAEGLRSAIAFPLLSRDGPVGVVEAFYDRVVEPDQDLLDTLTGIGRQVGQVVVRARADRALRAGEARMRGVLEGALDAIITIDFEGRVTGFNPAAERIFGVDAQEVMGRELAGVIVPPDLREDVARVIRTGDGRGLGRRVEVRGMRADGAEFPAELSITRLPTKGPEAFAAHIRDITERVTMLDELRASRARVVEAADAERRRVERDLHDGAQQRLLAVAMDLRLAAEQVAAGEDGACDTLSEAAEELDRATTELRELARGLHPAILTERGLEVAIAGLIRRAPLPVDVQVELAERPSGAVEAAAYFVVAESLTNIARYARAETARVAVGEADGALTVEVVDDGCGGAALDGGTGLRGLADRLAVLDGTLALVSEPGRGTRVLARIPLGT
jgi:PAS domain S-box-containing protein